MTILSEMNKQHLKTKIQIDFLQENLMNCRNEEEIQAIRELVAKLKHTQSGTISKSELANQYNITMLTLNRRMKRKDGLINELYESFGYDKWRKFLMPAEVECIYAYLGIPPKKI